MRRHLGLSLLIFLFVSLLLGGTQPAEAKPSNGGDDDCPDEGYFDCYDVLDPTTCGLPGDWMCYGSSCPSPYCSEPWSKVNFKCRRCYLIIGGTCEFRSWETKYWGTACYSGDVCSSNPGAGWIDAGHCGSGGCWYGGIYKRCCSGTQFTGNPKAAYCWMEDGVNRSDCRNPSACSSQYGNGYAVCTSTQGWNTCKTPCTCDWVNQSCGGWTCTDTQRHQTLSCTPSGCDSGDRCVADATCDPGCDCTAWADQGCGPAGGCAETEMYQTRSCNPAGCDDTTRCASDPDCGGSECSITCGIPCCPNNWWDDGNPATKNCGRCGCPSTHSAQCNGDGTAWDCVPNPGLCPDDGPDPEYHKVCSGGSCVTVEGAGSDQCSYNYECSHWDCDPPGGGVGAVCRKYSTPGTSKCGSDSDCRPPECVQTTINGGATYTNSRDVTLSLSASNADEMRFRNEDPNWSGWETYRTRKSWTLSNGDGTKTVTAQYRNDIGRSKGIAACKDSITLDTTPPISSMTPLSAWSTDYPLTLSWSGSDNFTPANELKYWLQYNKDSSSWIDLLGSQTIPTGETSWDFYGEEGVLYCFRVRARDLAGNWEDWPFPYDTCTTIDLGPPEISAGWEIGVERPSVWATVYDEVSGIDYSYPSSLNCEYSLNGGANWTAAPHDQTPPYNTPGSCSFSSADPLLTVLTLYKVPFDAAPPVNNMVRFSACDVAGSCLTNTYTIDNRTTGAWVQTFGGDVHGNANLQLRPAPD